VARDRQRAKQRRSRKPGAGGPAAGSARTRDRTSSPPDLDPTGTDLSGATPPPEPTEHAFPDVEEARMAEAGAVPHDYRPEPDDLERSRDLASASSVRREAAREQATRAQRGRLLSFLGHVIDELRRVQWPDRRQVGQGTLVTLIFVLVAGGYLGLLDAIWKPVIQAIL
jgi:preprotein translocase SecE subunit